MIGWQSWEEYELKYKVDVTLIYERSTLIHLKVRSFMIKLSMCFVITCGIVKILLLNIEFILF
jgi:hypothetical protein